MRGTIMPLLMTCLVYWSRLYNGWEINDWGVHGNCIMYADYANLLKIMEYLWNFIHGYVFFCNGVTVKLPMLNKNILVLLSVFIK